jgi:hypothetical protein
MRCGARPPASFAAATVLATIVVPCAAVNLLCGRAAPPGPSAACATHIASRAELQKQVNKHLDNPEGYAVARLRDGNFLVVGGFNGRWLNTAEIYEPVTRELIPTKGHMADCRAWATATLLRNGEVLVAGGRGGCCYGGPGGCGGPWTLATAELYDPATQTFRCVAGKNPPTHPGGDNCPNVMVEARDDHAATLLPDGTVLITGGHSTENETRELDDPSVHSVMKSAEIYDPATGSFHPTRGMMHFARAGHTATLQKSGKVPISGGGNDWADVGGSNTGGPPEVYNPKTGAFKMAKPAAKQ